MNLHQPVMDGKSWTPVKVNKAWRIFNQALPVIAAGVGVPPDELRAFLIEGWEPPRLVPENAPPLIEVEAKDDAILARAPAAARFMLKGTNNWYLHMSCEMQTADKKLAWIGKREQLRAVRRKYPESRALKIVRVAERAAG